ncbi:hypothetical protein ACTXT7_002464 [Hymenolepis weldensis]
MIRLAKKVIIWTGDDMLALRFELLEAKKLAKEQLTEDQIKKSVKFFSIINNISNDFDRDANGNGNPDQNYDQLDEYLKLIKMKTAITLHVAQYSVSEPIDAELDYAADELLK